MPSLFRHETKSLAVSVHVDDEIVVGEDACLQWLDSELKKHFTIQAEGPFPVGEAGEGEQMEYPPPLRHQRTKQGT